MKQVYEAPLFEVETYELDANIASHCTVKVTNGPAVGSHEQCDDYDNPFLTQLPGDATTATYNVDFYEDTNCDCYYSASGNGYWTS